MGTRTHLSKEQIEYILTERFVFGTDIRTLASLVNKSDTTVSAVISAFNVVKSKDWDKASELIEKKSIPNYMLKWAASKLGVDVPPKIEEAYERTLTKQRDLREKEKNEKALDKPPSGANENLYFIRILEELTKQNELLLSLLDVVIPKYVGDLKDNFNLNTDVMCEYMKKIETCLEGIKANTRKRGL